ncbi:MAG TPA: NUDIX domain-containing protein [Mariprofundaceae bacterium]|nr:NUDIX domain-containing protein [Mariprofundaceae bacterium]
MEYRITDKRPLYQGFFRLDACRVEHDRFDGGRLRIVRENLERGDAVAILLYDRERDLVLLIEQFRIGPAVRHDEAWLLEIVAGMVDAGEDIETCARRECLEEAGYEPRELTPLGSYYASPGGSSERIHLLLGEVDAGRRQHNGGGLEHEHEDIRTLWISRREALTWVKNGKIHSAAPMLALMLAFGPLSEPVG